MDSEDLTMDDILAEAVQPSLPTVTDDDLGRLEARRARFSASRSGAAGSTLVERMSGASRRRFLTARVLERSLVDLAEASPDAADFSALIFIGCQVLEEHMRDLLEKTTASAADAIMAGLADNPRLLDILKAWQAGRCPITLGTLQAFLVGHRRLADRLAPGEHPLMAVVDARYLEPLRQKAFEKCVGIIRERFRNPVAHASSAFGPEDYRRFNALLLGAVSLESWDRDGPNPLPTNELAVLHHHLVWTVARAQ